MSPMPSHPARRPRSVAIVALALAFLIALAGLPAVVPTQAEAARVSAGESVPGYLIPIVLGPDLAEQPAVVARQPVRPGAAAATFTVNYDSNFTPEAKAAFQAAVDIWAAQLTSSVPIVVNASYAALGGNVLGSAGPANFRRNFANAPQQDTLYPIASANKLAGTDLDPGNPDITAQFSSQFTNWYFGNGTTPQGKINFTSVVLHELGHGLGFLGSGEYNAANTQGSWGLGDPATATIWDRFVFNASGDSFLDTSKFPNPSTALGGQLTGNALLFTGANAKAANGGVSPKLYAPATWEDGSSYSHLDETTYPAGNANALMTPSISPGETIYDPGAIVRGMFTDMGWTTNAPGGSPSPSASPSPSPSPNPTGTYADVPDGYWARAQIMQLTQRGITTGCADDANGNRLYCPERGVTRDEMAVFLVRTLGQGTLNPATPTFADVPTTYWAYGFIERFVTLGITTGCGTNATGQAIYCPDRPVTRAEMAVFIVRAKQLAPLTPATATFVDVPTTYWAFGQIERFVQQGVTTGCDTAANGQRSYCPERGVTRAEMAVFIIRAYPAP